MQSCIVPQIKVIVQIEGNILILILKDVIPISKASSCLLNDPAAPD